MTPDHTSGGPFRAQRLRKGLTLRELAERCTQAGAPVTEGQVSRIERRLVTPRPKLRAVLAGILEMDAAEIEAEPKAQAS